MIGVIINVVTVILGSCIGLIFKKKISDKISKSVMVGLGVCTLYIGIAGSLEGENVIVAIVSIVLGVIIGTLLNIDDVLNKLSKKVEEKFKKDENESSFAEGLLTSTLLFCVGSMTITGSIQAGINGDNSLLITKAMLDFVSAMMLASSLGIGVLFSSISVLVIQGGLVLLSWLVAPVLSSAAINEITCVGSLLIIMIGTNLMGITKIKVADFLPAILLSPFIYYLISYSIIFKR